MKTDYNTSEADRNCVNYFNRTRVLSCMLWKHSITHFEMPENSRHFLRWMESSPFDFFGEQVGMCIYMNVHSHQGKQYTPKCSSWGCGYWSPKVLWSFQHLDFNPIVISYKQSWMGTAPWWVLWRHSGWIRMRCWFHLDFCPYVHRTALLALFAFAAKFISVSASVHGQDSASASFMVHLLLFHHFI